MSIPKIIVELRGGNIQQVYSDAPVEVEVLDWDHIDAMDTLDEMEAKREECEKLEAKTKKMKIAW